MNKKEAKERLDNQMKQLGVPESFYRGDDKPRAATVEEAIRILQQLPPEMPFRASWSSDDEIPAELTVFNAGDEERMFATFGDAELD